ncbi:MAG: dihydrofolate reductase [Planctomycetota bacterium]|nr:dihydrofolate reductase [Planctomycetota bacterium]
MALTLIAAMSENHVIGVQGDLPWRLPEDLKRFKRLTLGHHVIMGRKTYQTLNKPLPDRVNIVVTRQADFQPDGVKVAHTLQDALDLASEDSNPFILGGGEIYALALPRADTMELTIVHAHIEGDTFFPDYDVADWTLIHDEHHEPDDKHEHAYSFRTYGRV